MTKQTKIYHVEPLRTAEEIEQMKWAIKRGNKGAPKRPELADRDALIFLLGINTGLRVNDIVRLRIADLCDQTMVYIREGETNKRRAINIGIRQDEINASLADFRLG